MATASATNTSFRATKLRPATKYVFQLFAQNGAGSSPGVSATDESPAAAIVKRQPQWSDLFVTAVHPGEIDVTRVQMLFFTLISAGFVARKLFNSYVIPDIAEGFICSWESATAFTYPTRDQGTDPSQEGVSDNSRPSPFETAGQCIREPHSTKTTEG
jgi:hypothetical protein